MEEVVSVIREVDVWGFAFLVIWFTFSSFSPMWFLRGLFIVILVSLFAIRFGEVI